MENNDLRKLLIQLHDEIEATQAVDEKESELLHNIEGDIAALLGHSEEAAEPSEPINIQNLESAVSHFEVTHPDLTATISKLLDTLSSSGI